MSFSFSKRKEMFMMAAVDRKIIQSSNAVYGDL